MPLPQDETLPESNVAEGSSSKTAENEEPQELIDLFAHLKQQAAEDEDEDDEDENDNEAEGSKESVATEGGDADGGDKKKKKKKKKGKTSKAVDRLK
jgi:glycylpeptide N-tetradecanoyltransferase